MSEFDLGPSSELSAASQWIYCSTTRPPQSAHGSMQKSDLRNALFGHFKILF